MTAFDLAGLDDLPTKSAMVDDTQRITFTGFARADRICRQIIEVIEAAETPAQLSEYMESEADAIQAVARFSPEMQARIMQAAQDQAAYITPRPEPSTAAPCSKPKANDMASNPDFLKVMARDVEFRWPRLDQPYRFDPTSRRSVACAPSAQGAAYSIGWVMPKADAAALKAEVTAHYNDCRSRNSRLPELQPGGKVFGAKLDGDTGLVLLSAKKNAMSKAGDLNKPPRVVDASLKKIDDMAIWSGSKGSLRMLAFPSTDPNTGEGGITLLLDVVQVTDAVYGGDNLEDDFGPAETPADKLASLDDDFDTIATAAAAAPAASVPDEATF